MRRLLILIGILVTVFTLSCKKDTSVSDSSSSGGGSSQTDTKEIFYFEAVGTEAVIEMEGSAHVISLEYSTDKSNWLPFIIDETSVTLSNVGDKVYIRADGSNNGFGGLCHFTSTKTVNVGGNIMYLMDGTGSKTNFDTQKDEKAFSSLFEDMVKLRDASALVLPATTLAPFCYSEMFSGCNSLTKAPALPATTLARSCYSEMFRTCSSLTEAPALPATTLATYCYKEMFARCNLLTKAPELPATTLDTACYYEMFCTCSSLTEAPALPATTLTPSCYNKMFSGCNSLTKAPDLPATTLTSSCYRDMFSSCSSLTLAPALPATTLADYCYNSMFSYCTSLTDAPTLPATILTEGCYGSMFYNCRSLQNIDVNFTQWSSSTSYWVKGVASDGMFHCPRELDYSTKDESHIPEGWTIVQKVY